MADERARRAPAEPPGDAASTSAPRLDDKVAALNDPAAYPARPARVDAVETHMAWVFLTDRRAYKMKKPVRTSFLDFSTTLARRRDCEREVVLNRRLAADVYLGVVSLDRRASGRLALGGGEPVEWLVEMRRLAADRAMSAQIERGRVDPDEVRTAAAKLARFYERARPEPIAPREYRRALADGIRRSRHALSRACYRLPIDLVVRAADAALAFIEDEPEILGERARRGRVVDGHGDLRPEHVFLGPEPEIIDCLEFNRDLRILDAASELAFLALECERLGAPWIGSLALDTYADITGDRPPPRLVAFYTSLHAYTRAKVAIWHLDDPRRRDGDHFTAKATRYLERAAVL